MVDNRPLALQLCPFSPEMEEELGRRVECVRWFELEEEGRENWLQSQGAQVRVVLTGGHIGCPPALMRSLPRLGLVAINGVGFDKVDLALSREQGVRVCNTPDVLTEDVADLAVGLVIALKRRIPAGDRHVREGRWPEGDMPLGRKVSGSRFGILGLGRIGSAIAQRLAPFGEVAYTAREDKMCDLPFYADAAGLAEWCDVLVIACAATDTTHHLVNSSVLEELGPQGWLVNVSRGSVVDEEALVAALEKGAIAGAALDVFAAEPSVPISLRQSERTVLTPHVASASVETRAAMARLVLANVDAFLAGHELPTPVV